MTAPLHPPTATLREEVTRKPCTGVMANVLRFWLSDRMLLIGIAGFLAGFLVMVNAEMQLIWLAATCHPALLANILRTRGDGMTRDPVLRLAAAFLGWNLVVGVLRNHAAFSEVYTGEFFTGSLLLPVYLAGLWLVCRMKNGVSWILRTLMWCGIVAAITGLIHWRLFLAVEHPGARLRNYLVHWGQHPVSSAMCLSMAMLASVACYWRLQGRGRKAALLAALAVMTLAVMLTLSRGALVALIYVPLTFLAATGAAAVRSLVNKKPVREGMSPYWRALVQSWPPMAVIAGVGVWFLLWGGMLAPTPPERPPGVSPDAQVIYVEQLTAAPLEEYFARKTSGRTNIYRLGMEELDSWDKWVTGAGLWGPELRLQETTSVILGSSGIDHFHSILLATLIHGGIIGSVLLLALLILGVRRALLLVKAGQPQWLAFLVFGIGSLVVDGQSMCSLVTHPRFESFVLWFPLIAAAACASRCSTQGRQPSSSESR